LEVIIEVADGVHFLRTGATTEEKELVTISGDFHEQQEVINDVAEREHAPEDHKRNIVDEDLVKVFYGGVDVITLRGVF
jgi:hypothetical protein